LIYTDPHVSGQFFICLFLLFNESNGSLGIAVVATTCSGRMLFTGATGCD
jgi:hypothetical protein